jgi:predicted O-linked N-acetylglucosamine transferase (SPINDLY family)
MRILGRVEGSILWLLASGRSAIDRLRAEAKSRGVDPQRLVFAEELRLPQHLERHKLADLFLDTFPYNAHTTASDALWAGLPILTRAGESFASRVAASLLNAIKLPELITYSLRDYEARAIELALDRRELRDIKRRLDEMRLTSALFDTPRYATHLESAYREMYRRWQSGIQPAAFDVSSDSM